MALAVQASWHQRQDCELGTREGERDMCGEGDAILLFLVSVFLSSTPEPPKGEGLAGWVSHGFGAFDGTR